MKKIMFFILMGCAELIIKGCSRRGHEMDIETPPSASSVKYLHSSSNEEVVKFAVHTNYLSYKYIDDIRQKIIKSGLILCKKSSISKWDEKPTVGVENNHDQYWIVEIYASRDYGKFILLRVDEMKDKAGSGEVQHFTIAEQSIPDYGRNLYAIKEVCG